MSKPLNHPVVYDIHNSNPIDVSVICQELESYGWDAEYTCGISRTKVYSDCPHADSIIEGVTNLNTMNYLDIEKVIRWAIDTNGCQFAMDVYDRHMTNETWGQDNYVEGKFEHMKRDFIGWMASLDNKHRQRLANAIENSDYHMTTEEK